jgi:hypothetical protein
MHRILRQEMADTLSQDQEFKALREEGFASVCTNVLCNEPYPIEFEALVKSNLPFFTQLKARVVPELYQMTEVDLGFFLQKFKSESTQIQTSDIVRMQKLISTSSPLAFESAIESFFQETINPVDRVIKQKKLFSVTWMLFATLEQRQLWCSLERKWFEKKLLEFMSLGNLNQNAFLLKLFGLLLSVNFEGNGNSHTTARIDFIESQSLQLLIANQVRAQWPHIFANYLSFIKNQNYMFTADELIALARKWLIDLEIYEWSKNDEASTPPSARLKVRLTNPSYLHWQVYSH